MAQEITEDMDARIRSMVFAGMRVRAIARALGISHVKVLEYCELAGIIERSGGKIKPREFKPGQFKNCDRCKFRKVCAVKVKNAFSCGQYYPDYKVIQERIERNRKIREGQFGGGE